MPGSHRTILALHLTSKERARVAQAARTAWVGADVVPVSSLDAALQFQEASGDEMVVIGGQATAEERDSAARATTPDGLPRWPVVVLGTGTPQEFIWYSPVADDDSAALAVLLAVAASQHASQRAAVRARGDFRTIARRVSHEMRSPLGSILTSVDVLREELEDKPGVVDGLLQPIVDSASDIMRLLDRLSLLTRATANPVESGPVDMGLVVWSARERCARAIAACGAEVVEPANWPEAWGVADWLEQVWENYLSNALDHGGGGRLRIELGWDAIDGGQRFYLRDHGKGVAPEIQPLLFRPFHQLHRTDSGRGLGLALVQRLVELQGGRCGYEPVEPHGACFFFSLSSALNASQGS